MFFLRKLFKRKKKEEEAQILDEDEEINQNS